MDALTSLFTRFDALPCAFTLHTPAGVTRLGDGEPAFALHVRNGRGTRALRSFDELTIAEAYVRGDLDLEGDAIRAMWLRHLLSDDRRWIKIWRRLQPFLFGREKLNPAWIAKHYDSHNLQLFAIDGDFRAYTPGIYDRDHDTLEEGTRRKYDFAFDQLRLRAGVELLDVGHGWGGFLQYCCGRGARGEGITLSRHQFDYVERLIAERGLDARVHYQDFFTYLPGKRFAAVSMMGVIEDLSHYPRVLERLAALVAPGGRVYLDFAAGKVPVDTSAFVTKHIWPGSFRQVYLPELLAAVDRSPFEVVGVWDDRRNYHLWARKGHQRWLDHREEVTRLSSEQVWRLFRLLIAGTAGVMDDPTYRTTAYRMALQLPLDRRSL